MNIFCLQENINFSAKQKQLFLLLFFAFSFSFYFYFLFCIFQIFLYNVVFFKQLQRVSFFISGLLNFEIRLYWFRTFHISFCSFAFTFIQYTLICFICCFPYVFAFLLVLFHLTFFYFHFFFMKVCVSSSSLHAIFNIFLPYE